MTLYTKENCAPCSMVKAYISTREDLKNFIFIAVGLEQKYSLTYPTLLINSDHYGGDLFITKAANIINFLKTLQVK